MAVYTIGDLHLSLGGSKPMDIFAGWQGHVERLEENWRGLVLPTDTVVIPGDISWAMDLKETLTDFQFIHSLPGKKIFLKGNHDYWWSTMQKMESFLKENCLDSIRILHNNSIAVEGLVLCGSRGWLFEQGEAQDQKVLAREAGRLAASLQSGKNTPGERVVFLHYPPVYGDQLSPPILDVLLEHKVRRCYYGHIHGGACTKAFEGEYMGITFRLVSADHLRFCPILVEEGPPIPANSL